MLSPHIEHCPRCKAMISAMASQDTVAQDSDAMPISSPLVSRQILRRIGDYEVVEELGRGGMGVVYKAWDKELRCYVAIKTILASRAGLELVLHRFRQEAQSLAKLRHPNIVAVHRMGSDDGTDYFVMDFIEGENLLQVIGQREISPRLAAEITSTICEGTQFAHEHQILHRDLKPANILLDNFGRVYITDFGLAKQLDSDAELSRDGQIFGTAAYMPPEQACGKMNEIDARSDVY